MNFKTFFIALLILIFSFSSAYATDANSSVYTIAIAVDWTNQGRALQLLDSLGIIKLANSSLFPPCKEDIISYGCKIEFVESEMWDIPHILADVDYGIFPSSVASGNGLLPSTDSLALMGSGDPFAMNLCVHESNRNSELSKTLIAAFSSQDVADYIAKTYPDKTVISVIEHPTNGYDESIDYDALNGTSIDIVVNREPHIGIAKVAKTILASKGITLNIIEVKDFVSPNTLVENGTAYANYFAHMPYQNDYNQQNGTHIVGLLPVHVEPVGIYGGKCRDISGLLNSVYEDSGVIQNYQSVIYLPSDLTIIEEEAFAGINVEAVILPDSCQMIKSRAFLNCPNLRYVMMPGNTEYAHDAFEGCSDFVIHYDGGLIYH